MDQTTQREAALVLEKTKLENELQALRDQHTTEQAQNNLNTTIGNQHTIQATKENTAQQKLMTDTMNKMVEVMSNKQPLQPKSSLGNPSVQRLDNTGKIFTGIAGLARKPSGKRSVFCRNLFTLTNVMNHVSTQTNSSNCHLIAVQYPL